METTQTASSKIGETMKDTDREATAPAVSSDGAGPFQMTYFRLYADASGESHFGDVEVPLTRQNFAPPAPPLDLAPYVPATRFTFLRFPPGWQGDWHPAPRRQFFCLLKGTLEATVSDGTTRRFGAGSVLLLEDTTGKGHVTRNIGEGDAIAGVTQLAD